MAIEILTVTANADHLREIFGEENEVFEKLCRTVFVSDGSTVKVVWYPLVSFTRSSALKIDRRGHGGCSPGTTDNPRRNQRFDGLND